MICPACSSPNEAGRKFCGECGTRLAAVCPSCGSPNSPTARFCGECGNVLVTAPSAGQAGAATAAAGPSPAPAAAPPTAAAPLAERRLVSVLFADLVGFTTLSEGRDPETVRELLSRYFEVANEVIAKYGGTVEKFIGDAVMALWGAPTAHEDDAERAVRAALDLVEAVRTLGPGIQARCGVLTGEAAVTIGARDQGMVAGDLVNTASRLQGVAPPGAVLVGEATRLASGEAIAYEEAGEQLLRGKAAPVPAWRAVRVVAQRGGRGRDDRLEAPFVGRDAELRLLKDLFHATSRERRVRLVSITGQAGIGKSRLAWEFLKYVDGVVEGVWWHEGRSPAYGEGITFWALGEMVRSRARLLESDDPATTRTRIADMLSEYVPDEAERRRVEPALLALLGVGEPPAAGASELFSAWRTFFERLASTGVVALLFEDLQWADPGTLDFIEHMLEWSRNVPILIITLSRPELLEKRPGWGAGRRAFLALDLQPLDEAAMRELLTGLVADLPEPAIRSIVTRAEGIPLYAVETIRMLVSDGRLVERDGGGYRPTGELGELAVPNTLHALIAARLDALDPADRTLVQDASVLGQSFVRDGVAAVAGVEGHEVDARLERLVRSELLRVEIDPRSPERGQYAFVQALIREVAYATLSLRDRRARHLAAARYFESLGDDELAGALAVHYVAAFRASAAGAEADALAGQAKIALRAAADRAIALGSPGQAVTFLSQAIELTQQDAERADLHERAGVAANSAARSDLALEHLEAAASIARALGDRRRGARIAARRGEALLAIRRRDEAKSYLETAMIEFADLGDDPDAILLARFAAAAYLFGGDYERAILTTDRVLAAAERQGLVQIAAETLGIKGTAAFYQGRQWEARALLVGSRQLAEEAGLWDTVLRAMVILPSMLALDDPRSSTAIQREAIALARRIGRRQSELAILFNASEDARRGGEWDWAVDELQAALQLDIDDAARLGARAQQLFFEIYRGTDDAVVIEEIEQAIRSLEDRDMVSGIDDLEGARAHVRGDWAGAARIWLRIADVSDLNAPYALPRVARAAVVAGDGPMAERALAALDAIGTRGRAVDGDRAATRAGLAALAGDQAAAMAGYRVAMATFEQLGLDWDRAQLALEAASLLGASEPDIVSWVDDARVILRSLRATPMLDRLDEAVARHPVRSETAGGGATPARPGATADGTPVPEREPAAG